MSRGGLIAAVTVLGTLVLGMHGSLLAQTELEITRPLDGATVRETVNIIVPASSVPEGGFISVMLGERFKCAIAKKSDLANAFVYPWDTKAATIDPTGRQIPPHEGRHIIRVQAHDASGKKYGDPKEITVHVRNNASEMMPPTGLRLVYNLRVGVASKYHFNATLNLKDISGSTDLAATVGQALAGADLIVRRSVEDLRPDGTALIRHKLDGNLKLILAGRMIPMVGLIPKAAYHVEDQSGRTTALISSLSAGLPISIDLLNLPPHRVRIGDTWTQPETVLRDVLTGKAVTLDCTSTLEGLEWEGGHPCAKIRTTFLGRRKLPYSTVLTEPVPIKGDTVTYFAFQVGKVVSSVTTATITAVLDRSAVSSLREQLLGTTASGYAPQLSGAASPEYSGLGDLSAGVPPPPTTGRSTAPTSRPRVFRGASASTRTADDRVNVTFEIKQIVELVH